MYILESSAIRPTLNLFLPQQIIFSDQVIVVEIKRE